MNVFELFGTIAINNKGANDALKDTSQKAERAGKQIQDAFKKVGTATAKVGKAIGTAAVTISTAWAATVESTRDYRAEMAKLDTAFVTNGHSAEIAMKTYKALQAVLGETDQSVEAANHLAVMCDNEEDLAKWTDICTGVFATFGDSLPIEGLTESANETSKVGQVTGQLADALNWAGISEDEFNLKLRACRTEQERQKLILDTLYPMYKDSADMYKENAESVMAANEANDNLTRAMAKLGAVGEPILTGIKNWVADMVNAAVPHLETMITKFGEVDSVWNDVIWPLLQSTAKVTFGVDVPDWTTIESSIITWWDGTAKPAMEAKFKATFGIDPPAWSEIPESIKTWWEGTAKPKLEGYATALMSITPPDLSGLMETIKTDWGRYILMPLAGLLTGNYLSIVPLIGIGLAATITSNWDTHIKPTLDEFLNQELDIKLPDWTQLGNDIKTNLDSLVTPEMKESMKNIGTGLMEAFGSGTEVVTNVLNGAKEFGQWCIDNKTSVEQFFATMTGNALDNTEGGVSVLELFGDAVSRISEIGVEKVKEALQWCITNGDQVANGLNMIAGGLIAGAIAAHPYAAAITAIVLGLESLLQAEEARANDVSWLDKYSDEELASLQKYIDAMNELIAVENSANASPERWAAARTAYEDAEAEVNAIKGLMDDYDRWANAHGEHRDGRYIDVPARLAEDTESGMQGELDSMTLEAVVKMQPDYSAIQSTYTRFFGGSYTGGGYGKRIAESKAVGLDEVPYDGYYAHLHKGEAILNRVQADQWRGGSTGKIEALLAQLVANTRGGQQVVLDSGVMVGQLAPMMDARLGTISGRKGRGN